MDNRLRTLNASLANAQEIREQNETEIAKKCEHIDFLEQELKSAKSQVCNHSL